MEQQQPVKRRNDLTLDKQYKLMQLVERDYATRRQTDEEFGAYATETLGFFVNGNNVFGARRALGIDAPRNTATNTALESRVLVLEKRLAELENHFNNHIHDNTEAQHYKYSRDGATPKGEFKGRA